MPKCAEGASKCIHTAYNEAFLPVGGNVIYAVAHQHAGGLGSTLHNGVTMVSPRLNVHIFHVGLEVVIQEKMHPRNSIGFIG